MIEVVSGGQLVDEALDLLRSFRSMVESKVLSKSATLKPQIVSIAQKLVDISNMLSRVFELASKHVSETDPGSVVVPSPWWSISIYSDRIVITRHKPMVTSIAYIKDEGKIVYRSKDKKLEIQTGLVKMGKRVLAIELDPGDPEDIARKLSEIKYVLRDIAGDLELLSYMAEKRLM